MRTPRRVDDNQVEIVKALRQAGCSVQSLAAIGKGVPDLLVARCGKMWLMEVKDGAKPPSARRMTPDEREWRLKWKAEVFTVNNVNDALAAITL